LADAQLMLELYGEMYRGWNVKHFHEHLVRDHGFQWGYTWVKTQLHTRGWWSERGGAVRAVLVQIMPSNGLRLRQCASGVAWWAACA
jgi:hypothetical protein